MKAAYLIPGGHFFSQKGVYIIIINRYELKN